MKWNRNKYKDEDKEHIEEKSREIGKEKEKK